MILRTLAAMPIVFSPSNTEAMRITSAGNLGIGTSSPTSKLSVSGAVAAFTGGLGVMFGFANSAVGLSDMGFIAMDNGGYGTSTDMIISPRNNTGQLGNTRFYNAGSERMRIDSSGNVGIGTTTTTYRTNIVYSNAAGGVAETGLYLRNTSTGNSTQIQLDGNRSFSLMVQGSFGAPAGGFTIQDNTAGASRLSIDSSGNVGIGTTSPAAKLQVSGGSGSLNTRINAGNTGLDITPNDATGVTDLATTPLGGGGKVMTFTTYNGSSSAEAMRITGGGEVYIAGTADQGAYNLQCNGTGVWGAGAYVNGSDARIKENIVSIDSGLDVVNKLNPVTYTYKEDWSKDQSTQTGFIAQELLVALEGKNYVDGIVQQGGEYMSVAYQNIIPLLTKSIQELSAKVEALEAQLQGK
jgi:hypothetical protein